MKKYDAVLILGRGVDKKGNIPKVVRALVEKAVELYKNDATKNLVFCGKSSYKDSFIYPVTEADAMAKYAKSLGIPDKSIFIENTSEATITNICSAKKIFLEPKNWKNIACISIYPLVPRMKMNFEYVLGKDYKFDFIDANFRHPKKIENEMLKAETQKIQDETNVFFKGIKKGDDKKIYEIAIKEINKRKANLKK